MEMLASFEFWIAVGQIILIDILLGGDNAVVIALACRKLPPRQRTQGILWGTAGAIVLRIVLIFFALKLLAFPFIKIVGALLLVWIGGKLLMPDDDDEGEHGNIDGGDRLWQAVKTVILADFAMSLDNVIAIAGAAEASGTGRGMALVMFGVLVSIPIIVWGSQMVIKLMDRFPIIIPFGGMLLGWIAGTMVVTDPALANPDVFAQIPKLPTSDTLRYAAAVAGALLVLALGKWLAARRAAVAAVVPSAVATSAAGTVGSVLLAVDGSEQSQRAVAQALALRENLRDPQSLKIHLLNVQRPVSGDVSSFVTEKSLQEYYTDRSNEALAPAKATLQARGVAHEAHHRVGTPGTTIAEVAHHLGCDLIVMGARGLGATGAALLGSVTQGAIEHAAVPVLIVK